MKLYVVRRYHGPFEMAGPETFSKNILRKNLKIDMTQLASRESLGFTRELWKSTSKRQK